MYLPQQPVRGMRPTPVPPAAPAEPRHLPLASSYTPVQVFRMVMGDADGLCNGTVFEELYLPLEEGGLTRGK